MASGQGVPLCDDCWDERGEGYEAWNNEERSSSDGGVGDRERHESGEDGTEESGLLVVSDSMVSVGKARRARACVCRSVQVSSCYLPCRDVDGKEVRREGEREGRGSLTAGTW